MADPPQREASPSDPTASTAPHSQPGLSRAARDAKGQQTGEEEQDMSCPPAGHPTSQINELILLV